jgi:hypothetical protein
MGDTKIRIMTDAFLDGTMDEKEYRKKLSSNGAGYSFIKMFLTKDKYLDYTEIKKKLLAKFKNEISSKKD